MVEDVHFVISELVGRGLRACLELLQVSEPSPFTRINTNSIQNTRKIL